MWDHTSDGLVEDTGRGAEVEWTTTSWVESSDLAEVCMVLDCNSGRVSDSVGLLRSILENVRLARKNSPEMLSASHLTTTIF